MTGGGAGGVSGVAWALTRLDPKKDNRRICWILTILLDVGQVDHGT